MNVDKIMNKTLTLYYKDGIDNAWFYLNMEIENGTISREVAWQIIEAVRTSNERRYAK